MNDTQPNRRPPHRHPPNPQYNDVRDVAEQFEVGTTTWTMISDPTNGRAWYQSTYAVEPRP